MNVTTVAAATAIVHPLDTITALVVIENYGKLTFGLHHQTMQYGACETDKHYEPFEDLVVFAQE